MPQPGRTRSQIIFGICFAVILAANALLDAYLAMRLYSGFEEIGPNFGRKAYRVAVATILAGLASRVQ